MKKLKDEYYFEKTIKYDNATVNIYRPIIREEEHERRMKKIHDAAADLLKERIEKTIKDCR